MGCVNEKLPKTAEIIEKYSRTALYRMIEMNNGEVPTMEQAIEFNKIKEQKGWIASKESTEIGKIGVNKTQLLALLGQSMYNAPLAQVAMKELLQNAFDAVKAGA